MYTEIMRFNWLHGEFLITTSDTAKKFSIKKVAYNKKQFLAQIYVIWLILYVIDTIGKYI